MVGVCSLLLHISRRTPCIMTQIADVGACSCALSQLRHYIQLPAVTTAVQSACAHSNHSLNVAETNSNSSSCNGRLLRQPWFSKALSSSSSSSHQDQASSSSSSSSSSRAASATAAAAAVGGTSTASSRPRRPHSSLDRREAAKFAALADKWWDKTAGPFAPLHALNTARCSFLRAAVCSVRGLPHTHAEPLQSLRVLDVGCGGGLLSEPVARMGASVHGIDVSDEGVAAAAAHAAGDPLTAERIRYQKTTLEQLVASGASYDIVMASEVIEHVRRPQQFMADLAAATRPGGQVFVTTLNRTPASYALAIVAAEYVLGFVPRGTHEWTKFITPQELAMMASDAGLKVELLAGMNLNPANGQFSLGDDMNVNYAALLTKPAAVDNASLIDCEVDRSS